MQILPCAYSMNTLMAKCSCAHVCGHMHIMLVGWWLSPSSCGDLGMLQGPSRIHRPALQTQGKIFIIGLCYLALFEGSITLLGGNQSRTFQSRLPLHTTCCHQCSEQEVTVLYIGEQQDKGLILNAPTYEAKSNQVSLLIYCASKESHLYPQTLLIRFLTWDLWCH